MSHISLESYYETFFAMMQHHNYSLTELENLIPWERDIYVGLLMEWIKEENESSLLPSDQCVFPAYSATEAFQGKGILTFPAEAFEGVGHR